MDVWRLESELDRIIDESDIPGTVLFEGLIEIARNGNWLALEKILGAETAASLRSSYESDPDGFCTRTAELARECKQGFVSNSAKRLAYLSRTNFTPGVKLTLAEEFQRALDSSGVMLEVAFAQWLIGLIEPAAQRAAKLKELVVNETSSEQADKYLAEACECYYFGLYTACVLMCRSLIEEALERKLPNALLDQWRAEAKGRNQELTLGALLWKVNNHSPLLVSADFLPIARVVNAAGTRAAHTETLNEHDARTCLQNARRALLKLLGSAGS
jgi:hypothetical protein